MTIPATPAMAKRLTVSATPAPPSSTVVGELAASSLVEVVVLAEVDSEEGVETGEEKEEGVVEGVGVGVGVELGVGVEVGVVTTV
jgi:hypothetical protein